MNLVLHFASLPLLSYFQPMPSLELVHKSFTLPTDSGGIIHGDVRCQSDGGKNPVIIICHSFMAFKEWGFFPVLASELARKGFVTVAFNFSRNGVVGNGNRITDFTAFESNTFSQELADLKLVVDSIAKGVIGKNLIDTERIALLGHSRGGGIAIVHTASDERIKALVTLSSVATFDRWTNHQKELWRKQGFLPLAKDSTVSPLRLGLGLLNDLENNKEFLNLECAASKITVPWLILHGKADVTVQPKEAERLYTAANKSTTELLLLDKVGHLYNAASQDEDNYQTLHHIIDVVSHWLQQKFMKEYV